jgi:hypothetical protein
MSLVTRRPAALLVVIALLLTALLAGNRLASEASPAPAPLVPADQAVGKITITGLPGSITFSTTIRGFSTSGSASGDATGGGGGAGAFTPGFPIASLDTATTAPVLHRAVATGVHLPTVTVVLYRPDSTIRLEQWKYDDVILSNLQYSQSGPPDRVPRLSLGWKYVKLEYSTYAANGTTLAQKTCWNRSTFTAAC